MSRVLNTALGELEAATLPAICAVTGRRDGEALGDDPVRPVWLTLYKLPWAWFFSALCFGPIVFALLDLYAVRRRVRLPCVRSAAAQLEAANRVGLTWLHRGYLAFLLPVALLALPVWYAAGPVLVVAGASWVGGLYGVWRLCKQANDLPALLEVFSADRVALELPNWWVADEYRCALGHAPQGPPRTEQSQLEEDAVWEARANSGNWDDAPPPAEDSRPPR